MNKLKVLSYGIGSFLVFIGVSAVVSGAALMWNPNGGLGMSVDILKNSPFSNFLIPGLFLFAVNGLASIMVGILAFRKHRFAGVGTLILGAIMMIWIMFEVYWIGWISWLQPAMLAVGFIEMGLGVYLNEMHTENQGIFKSHHHSRHAH